MLKRIPFYLYTIFAMILGCIVGLIFGKDAAFLGIFAQVIITLVKAFAVPLLFLTILESILDSQFQGPGIRKMLGISALNCVLAISLVLIIVDIFKPGYMLKDIIAISSEGQEPIAAKASIGWAEALQSLLPDSIFGPFVQNQMPAVIVLAILLGMAIRGMAKEDKVFDMEFGEKVIRISSSDILKNSRIAAHVALGIVLQIFKYILILIPVAIFAAVARSVGMQGLEVFKGLFLFVLVCCGGMFLQILVVYQAWVKFYAKRSLGEFWSKAKTPLIYAFGINSSLATLPMTLKALDELKVSRSSARLSACLGTNFNNDGIILYQVVAILMIAQATGMDMSMGQQLSFCALSILAALGVAGIPEAGVIALTILMTAAKLPLHIIPLLLSVDWLIARVRSATNVLGDMTVAIAIDGPGKK